MHDNVKIFVAKVQPLLPCLHDDTNMTEALVTGTLVQLSWCKYGLSLKLNLKKNKNSAL